MVKPAILKQKIFPIEYDQVRYSEYWKESVIELYYFFTGIILCVRKKLANNQISFTKDVKFAFLNMEFISIIG